MMATADECTSCNDARETKRACRQAGGTMSGSTCHTERASDFLNKDEEFG
ncbi:uncharacterized protein GLRG_11855 [Colletotrichum graminicola M1.001]|uniref:Uncharacterized protein n=1 Tax=Colletotrichum graminicola (strain M1.001 / M2 / FGSC 10212) TaxID=645133 RepID=E3R0R8_COLGM|nr:uncharacterized protein GLRG_11855 [Colletotrichum graminicola M1.001]EFQ36706.1 hypothetical protein GLRG_11855 [Colletotrichum graminicola M1.001]